MNKSYASSEDNEEGVSTARNMLPASSCLLIVLLEQVCYPEM
jgi:hypothetical protein